MMIRLLAVFCLAYVLAGCTGGAPTTPCPDPDPDPTSACAASHGQTYDGGGRP